MKCRFLVFTATVRRSGEMQGIPPSPPDANRGVLYFLLFGYAKRGLFLGRSSGGGRALIHNRVIGAVMDEHSFNTKKFGGHLHNRFYHQIGVGHSLRGRSEGRERGVSLAVPCFIF